MSEYNFETDDDLYKEINHLVNNQSSLVHIEEPKTGKTKPYEQIVLDGMGNEFKSKTSHQKLLIYGLICFLIVQLLMINVIIIYSIRQVYLVKDLELDIIKQYFEIFEFLKSYIKMVLVEFIAIFYFIVRWGFNNTLPELFKSLFIRKDIEEK